MSNFWGIYEVDFPEDAHAIGSRGIPASLWSLSRFYLYFINKK